MAFLDAVVTPGHEPRIEGIEGANNIPMSHQLQYGNPETATLKFNKLAAQTQQQLHRCYHSKKVYFDQFVAGLGFSRNEVNFLTIIIETQLCDNCNNNHPNQHEFETKLQQNCNKINAYFDEINTSIYQYHQYILKKYTDECHVQFRSSNRDTVLQIELNSIKQQLDDIFTDCYEIIDSAQPIAPNIHVTNGDIGGIVIEILDRDKAPNDKYEISINNIKKEFVNDDNKQQYIEIIDGIEPLTLYHIAARRYIAVKRRWSKYCDMTDIVTDVNFSWSKRYRGNNAKLSNLSRDVYCRSKHGSCSIVADKGISALKFKEVMFSFKMNSLGQFSYCGFVQYYRDVNDFEQEMMPYWDALAVKHPDSYCLGFCDGSNTIQRWVNGAKKGKSKWTKELKLEKGNKIHCGDVLLFHVDFNRMVCDVYLNEKTIQNKISTAMDQNTFTNVPRDIIPIYSHEHNPYIIAHSKVTIKMESYIMR